MPVHFHQKIGLAREIVLALVVLEFFRCEHTNRSLQEEKSIILRASGPSPVALGVFLFYFCYHLIFGSTNVVSHPGGSHARRKAVFWTGPLRHAGRAGAAPILPANRNRSCAPARRSAVGCSRNRLLGGCLRCHLGDGAAGSRRVWNGDLRRSMATLLRR